MTQQQILLWIVVEGPSEEGFVKRVIRPHLEVLGVWCEARTVTTSRSPEGSRRTGGGDWAKWKADIQLYLRDKRPNIRVTTLFDLYGLPPDFPVPLAAPAVQVPRPRIDQLEEAMERSIGDPRFFGYLQKHEFEALVLAGLPELETFLEARQDRLGLKRLVDDIRGLAPEEINDGPNTSPSKRLSRFIPSYDPKERERFTGIKGKSVYGPLVTERAGLSRLRELCPRFDAWVAKLEALGEPGG